MPNKRNNRNKSQKVYCPHCQCRVWRQGGEKHYLYYQEATEVKKRLNISRKKALFITQNNNVLIDKNTWIEEFICTQHGRLWLLVNRKANGQLEFSPAQRQDWSCTTHTINPDMPNPSVSEFSYRMSRKASLKNLSLEKLEL